MNSPFDEALARVRPVDADAAGVALAHQARLTKPAGALVASRISARSSRRSAARSPHPCLALLPSPCSPATTAC